MINRAWLCTKQSTQNQLFPETFLGLFDANLPNTVMIPITQALYEATLVSEKLSKVEEKPVHRYTQDKSLYLAEVSCGDVVTRLVSGLNILSLNFEEFILTWREPSFRTNDDGNFSLDYWEDGLLHFLPADVSNLDELIAIYNQLQIKPKDQHPKS